MIVVMMMMMVVVRKMDDVGVRDVERAVLEGTKQACWVNILGITRQTRADLVDVAEATFSRVPRLDACSTMQLNTGNGAIDTRS